MFGNRKPSPPSWRYAIPLLLSLVIFAALIPSRSDRWTKAKNDFVTFYLAGKLQPEGKMYEPQEFYKRHPEYLGGVAPALIYIRPPFYSWLFVPLAKLPYLTAYALYLLLQISLLSYWLYMAWPTSPRLLLAVGVSLPLLFSFANGQDVILLTSICGIAWLLLEKRPLVAGLLLALCSIKAHLFLLVPFALARYGRWRTIAGGAIGGVLLTAASFLAGGANWLADYRRILAIEDIDESVALMGNMRALADAAGLPGIWPAVLTTAGVAASLWLIYRSGSLAEALVAALCGGLVFSWHGYVQDFTLLLTLVPFVQQLGLAAWADRSWRFLLSPIPYMAALPGAPYSALLPISMLAFLRLSQNRKLT